MMNWIQLLSAKRYGLEDRKTEVSESERTQFQRDYDRLIFSSPFRRLQNKTQVFPLPGAVFVHNRLTHSLEVASVGRSLGNNIALELQKKGETSPFINEIGTIVSTACLAHDLGNPPFGHSGEKAISNYFVSGLGKSLQNEVSESVWSDWCNFEGNANALRLLTHQFNGRRFGGSAMTYSTLSALVKYPCESVNRDKSKVYKKKYGYFQPEKEVYQKIAQELGIIKFSENPHSYYRHPLVFLVEAADDICYNIIDLEDAHRLGILTFDRVKELYYGFFSKEEVSKHESLIDELDDKNEELSYLRANVIGKLIYQCTNAFMKNHDEILNGTYNKSLYDDVEDNCIKAAEKVTTVSINEVYQNKSVVEIEVAGYKILGGLLEEFASAVLNQKDAYSKMLLKLLPKQYAVSENQTIEENIYSILDFVSGMTDVYAVELYKKIKGVEL